MDDDAQKNLHSSPGATLMYWFSESHLLTSITVNVPDFLSPKLRIDKCEWDELKCCQKYDKNQWKVYENHCSVLTFKKNLNTYKTLWPAVVTRHKVVITVITVVMMKMKTSSLMSIQGSKQHLLKYTKSLEYIFLS